MMLDTFESVDLIREVFAYTEKFKGATFVIRIANAIVDHPNFSQHVGDLALLHKAGIRIVMVPGANQRIDEHLDRFGIVSQFVDGIRISEPDSMELIKTAAFDVAHRVMTALSANRITAVIGNWVRTRSMGVINGVDYQRTGLVDRIREAAVMQTLSQGHVVIFPSIGHNIIGDPFNLSSDELAASIAVSLKAKKLFYLDALPVMKTPKWNIPTGTHQLDDGRIFRMTPSVINQIIELNADQPGIKTLRVASKACQDGIERVHLLDGRQTGVLLKEIFSNLGVGNMIYSDDYECVRPMDSTDVPHILEIMKPLIEQGILVERTQAEIESRKNEYWVYEMDGIVHGCAALHQIDSLVCEIAGVAVEKQYAQLGTGAKLINRLLEKAMESGAKQVVVLTTRTSDWFLAQGFRLGDITDLPAEKAQKYNRSRNSRILVKDLNV